MNTLLTPFRAFDTIFGPTLSPAATSEDVRTTLRPRVDIHESEQEYRVRVDLPGVQKDDLSVEVEKGNLVLRAQREATEDSLTPIRVERRQSVTYVRSFSLGDDVDADNISAELKDGVLTVSLPKQEKSLPRRIQVR